MTKTLAVLAILCATSINAALGGSLDPTSSETCTAATAFTPAGMPAAADGRQLTVICHSAYLTALNPHREVPDWVAWTLTPAHALGCEPRSDAFTADPQLPKALAVVPDDYLNSGFDKGHFAPDKDFAWDHTAERESFYMTNMSPQAKGLNEQGWEQVEQETRVWAWSGKYGALYLMDGPLYGHHPQRIGVHNVAVPAAYWKLIVSPSTGHALAYVMPNLPVTKKREGMHLVAIADVERLSGLSIALPPGIDRSKVELEWSADLAGYAKAKKAKCGKE